jgi:HAD superfamily hydrolase (TIGR01509 family)
VCRLLRILLDLEVGSEEFRVAREGHLARLVRVVSRPAPGVPEVPRQLADAGFQLGLMTSGPAALVNGVLEALGLDRRLFAVLVPTTEVPRAHPAPDGHLMAARRLGVTPEACLAVESSRDGVLAARAAGMFAAAIPCPATSQEEFGPADLVLPRLDALPKALGLN